MAEDFAGDKSEAPTPRKRQEAREKGQVAKSQDLNTALLLTTGFGLVYMFTGWLMGSTSSIFRHTYSLMGEPLTLDGTIHLSRSLVMEAASILAPVVGGLFAVALLGNLLQVGWTVSFDPLTPNPEKLSPLKGAQRIFSRRSVMRLLFGVLKLTVVGVVLFLAYTRLLDPGNQNHFLAALHLSLPSAVEMGSYVLFKVAIQACVALIILAILDFLYQRWQHEKDLMMTKQEVKEEFKRMEGDPRLKDRRRRVGQQIALQRMIHDVPRADVVITNPTHYACAIRYDQANMRAPRLVAKGVDLLALRIRKIAEENGVPVHEEPPLARSIHATTEIGEEIPPELYGEVARVLAYVYRLDQRQRDAESAERAGV